MLTNFLGKYLLQHKKMIIIIKDSDGDLDDDDEPDDDDDNERDDFINFLNIQGRFYSSLFYKIFPNFFCISTYECYPMISAPMKDDRFCLLEGDKKENGLIKNLENKYQEIYFKTSYSSTFRSEQGLNKHYTVNVIHFQPISVCDIAIPSL